MDQKYFCRNCKGLRNHKKIHEVVKEGSIDNGFYQWTDRYLIIECFGCETVSFLNIYGDSEMFYVDEDGTGGYETDDTVYPHFLEKGIEITDNFLLPVFIREIYRETISVMKAGSYILAAGGLRAIIEAVCNDLKIKKGDLSERIELLHSKGHLTVSESKRLHSIRFLGNDALHEIEKPSKDNLYILLDIVNHLLVNLYVADKKIDGKMDVVIDKYDAFLRLVQNLIKDEMVGKEYTISQILGKSSRRILKRNSKAFCKKLEGEIEKGQYDFLSIQEKGDNTKFKVEKVPEFSFGWE